MAQASTRTPFKYSFKGVSKAGLSPHLSFFFYIFVVNFVINWNETVMGLHVFPIPIPPPASLSTRSL